MQLAKPSHMIKTEPKQTAFTSPKKEAVVAWQQDEHRMFLQGKAESDRDSRIPIHNKSY